MQSNGANVWAVSTTNPRTVLIPGWAIEDLEAVQKFLVTKGGVDALPVEIRHLAAALADDGDPFTFGKLLGVGIASIRRRMMPSGDDDGGASTPAAPKSGADR